MTMRHNKEILQSYFRDILYAVYLVMARSGASARDISEIVTSALSAAKSQLDSASFASSRISATVAGVLHRWHHDRRFLDADGNPRRLAIHSGKRSLALLIRAEDRRADVSAVVAAMRRLRLIRSMGDERYWPTTRFATISELDPVLAEHVCHSLGRLLTTVNNNTGGRAGTMRFIERSAQVQDLPRKKLSEFRDFANAQGDVFVSSMNDWLEARRASGTLRRRASVARAGVHVFAFTEPVLRPQRAVLRTTPRSRPSAPA